ncbi:MAG: RagB/SusD family nutrient uptake outer membrane protein [Bacteroidales bacterium]|nr:RagB/SusD family nutrient uptake outer membrane protein [Bacteroidales bacterium]
MKALKYISILLLSSLVSCQSLLVERRATLLSEKDVYSTEESLEACISGCYSKMGSGQGWKGGMIEYLQEASGLVHWSGSRSEEHWLQCLDFTLYSNNTWNEQFFIALNEYIAAANLLITKLPESPVDEGFKREIEAEARFIRAVTYFSLVRMYGDVPLRTSAVTGEKDVNVPRTPYTKVYRQILEDLDYAEMYMRDAARQAAVSGLKGRPNKWAATSYKSLVYLTIACILDTPDYNFFDPSKPEHVPDFSDCGINTAKDAWLLCLSAAENVMQNGPYELAKDYAQLFRWGWKQEADGSWTPTPEDFQLKERIFVLQSTDNATTNTNYAVQRTVPAFPEGTLDETAENPQAGRIRPERYVVQKWTKEYGGHLDTDRGDKLTGVWVGCKDPRFDVSYVHTGYNFNHINYKQYIPVYPADGAVKFATNTTLTFSDGSTYSVSLNTSAIFKKYIDHLYNAGKGNADFYMMRYAEIYLIAAEACAALSAGPGDTYWQKALDYVEVLHKRARGEMDENAVQSAIPTWNDGNHDFTDKDALIKAIMWERVYEMGGEGHEFFDTHRRGAEYLRDEIAMPINAFLSDPEQMAGETYGYFNRAFLMQAYPTSLDDIRRGLLCAFPNLEIRYNQAISEDDQNDYFVR